MIQIVIINQLHICGNYFYFLSYVLRFKKYIYFVEKYKSVYTTISVIILFLFITNHSPFSFLVSFFLHSLLLSFVWHYCTVFYHYAFSSRFLPVPLLFNGRFSWVYFLSCPLVILAVISLSFLCLFYHLSLILHHPVFIDTVISIKEIMI